MDRGMFYELTKMHTDWKSMVLGVCKIVKKEF